LRTLILVLVEAHAAFLAVVVEDAEIGVERHTNGCTDAVRQRLEFLRQRRHRPIVEV
jgi:hypothetical protein